MAYTWQDELKKVKEFYNSDSLQKRFSAIICGETNAGKTFILRTARRPIHIDSFDPGGSKCLDDLISSGDVVVDTRWENEDPKDPKAFAEWLRVTKIRKKIGYFDNFGTYCLDSLSTFGDAVMNNVLQKAGRAGEAPKRNHDYNPQKIAIQNEIRDILNFPCDFILTAHLDEKKLTIGVNPKTNEPITQDIYRIRTTGKAVVSIPLLFDELYVIIGKNSGGSVKREMLLDSCGQYIARSRLKGDGKLNTKEPPDIKALLKKAGFNSEDKAKLQLLKEEDKVEVK